MNLDENPESRVSLIAVIEERKVLLKRSPERWSNFLTVPGKKIELGKDNLQTLMALLEEQGLSLIPGEEPEFLPKPYHAMNPKQYTGPRNGIVHLIFDEVVCRVQGKPKEGKFYDRYRTLHESKKYYEKRFIENIDVSLVVEEITYNTLTKHAGHIFRNHQPK